VKQHCRLLALCLSLLAAAVAAPGTGRALEPGETVVAGPVLALWKDSGSPLALDVPSGTLHCAEDAPLVAPDGRRYRLDDPEQALPGAILSGLAPETSFLVSTAVPGLIVGLAGPDGRVVRARLAELPGEALP